jgi:E3 ubiquitin-protein ligase UBR1
MLLSSNLFAKPPATKIRLTYLDLPLPSSSTIAHPSYFQTQSAMEHQSLEDYFRTLPHLSNFRYSPQVANALVYKLFQSLAADNTDYLHYLFPSLPSSNPGSQRWSLREAQGAIEGAEYTEGARGQACGHIFRPGEATYQCRACGADDTCVMCSRCFEASDHEGHPIYIVMSGGHAGCCDCGDPEAWNRPMHCSIHSVDGSEAGTAGKGKAAISLPPQLVDSIKKTIARAMDYLVDVWSCSPEQLRLPKTDSSVFDDVRFSRISDEVYGGSDPASPENEKIEYALVLWNDEKHTIDDVEEIVARACKKTKAEGRQKADEIDAVGRAVISYSTDLAYLLKAATVLEQPNLSVSIRASRDIFREHMCATIVEWMIDISGCTVGPDPKILRTTICEELLSPWRIGSEAHHKYVGENGLYDHDREDIAKDLKHSLGPYGIGLLDRLQRAWGSTARSSEDEDADTDEDIDMDVDGSFQYEHEAPEDTLEAQEATLAGYPPPPPPPPPSARRSRTARKRTMSDGGEGDSLMAVPRTPLQGAGRAVKSSSYWTEKPAQFTRKKNLPPAEDLWQRVRLDYLILYDLRMWKQLRINLREVLVSTVITMPEFKRLLALRFASMYTVLAELHLIADREPEHSVLFLSLQIITTPSITAEIVERGNFLTNLMAIIYTFLTTRQVGYPSEVDLSSTLAIDQGVVFNRRATSFYHDMKYLFNLDVVKEKIKREPRYLQQFLDIAKIHQGICPNVRAIEEHVEYEMETWLSLSNVMSEIMRLCRLFAESFSIRSMDDQEHLQRALRTAAGITIINSLGGEKNRFTQNEIKNFIRFKDLYPAEFSGQEKSKAGDTVLPQIVKYEVDSQPISCYHPMHYLLSWLIAECRSYPVDHVRSLLHFTKEDLVKLQSSKTSIHLFHSPHGPEANLLALFDFPIRVCVWMAQIRSGMWVRNGISLRHQLQQYKSVSRRELTFQRDIFMVQSAFVLCDPGIIMSTIIDRFDLTQWFEGSYLPHKAREEHQTIDVAEELIHLIIAVLSDRLNIIPGSKEEILTKTVRREIIHALCFKTLSYTELKKLLTEGVRDADDQGILHELTTFKGPEGVSDHGVFSLKEEYLEYVDPYLLNLSGNQREEAESLYRKYMAKKTGKDISEIIYEPRIEPIESGVFKDLSAVITTPVFAQMLFYFIQYTMLAPSIAPEVPSTKVDQFFQFLLHLTLVAAMLDKPDESRDSFCRTVFTKEAKSAVSANTIVGLLHRSMEMDHLKPCAPKVKNILEHLRRKVPTEYGSWLSTLKTSEDAQEESSLSAEEARRDLKKKQAQERQAKVMAQLKQQQDTFLQNQSVDWSEDLDEDPEAMEGVEHVSTAKFPAGPCILCQEETDNGKLYGTFAFISRSRVFRRTPPAGEWQAEALETPQNLDRTHDERPFGVAGQNRRLVKKALANGTVVELERQELAVGFPSDQTYESLASTGCGHIMHEDCFEVYLGAVRRRHAQQIARHHPENLAKGEFLCPLCKALGNAFLPIVWRPKTLLYPGPLASSTSFEDHCRSALEEPSRATNSSGPHLFYRSYGESDLITPLALAVEPAFAEACNPSAPPVPVVSQPTSPTYHFRIRDEDDAIVLGFNIITGEETLSASLLTRQLVPQGQLGATGEITFPELHKVYRYMASPYHISQQQLAECIPECFASTICSVEIAQRGVGTTALLLDGISSQTLTHLRVLAETALALQTVNLVTPGIASANPPPRSSLVGDSISRHDNTIRDIWNEMFSLTQAPAHLALGGVTAYTRKDALLPFLQQNAFKSFCVHSLTTIPSYGMDIKGSMKLFCLAEITRVIVWFFKSRQPLWQATQSQLHSSFERAPAELMRFVHHLALNRGSSGEMGPGDEDTLYHLVKIYSLQFLRRCIILMHVRYNVDFPKVPSDDTELARMTGLLQLPSLPELLDEARTCDAANRILFRWTIPVRGTPTFTVQLDHPAIFELVGLPKNFDTLQDVAMRQRCPRTGRVMLDPSLCLICGAITCSQSTCCNQQVGDKRLGGCQQHTMEYVFSIPSCSNDNSNVFQVRRQHWHLPAHPQVLRTLSAPRERLVDGGAVPGPVRRGGPVAAQQPAALPQSEALRRRVPCRLARPPDPEHYSPQARGRDEHGRLGDDVISGGRSWSGIPSAMW